LLPGALLAAVLYVLLLRPSTPYPNFVKIQVGYEAKTLLDWPLMWWRFSARLIIPPPLMRCRS
jgi:hypothetical protein